MAITIRFYHCHYIYGGEVFDFLKIVGDRASIDFKPVRIPGVRKHVPEYKCCMSKWQWILLWAIFIPSELGISNVRLVSIPVWLTNLAKVLNLRKVHVETCPTNINNHENQLDHSFPSRGNMVLVLEGSYKYSVKPVWNNWLYPIMLQHTKPKHE